VHVVRAAPADVREHSFYVRERSPCRAVVCCSSVVQ